MSYPPRDPQQRLQPPVTPGYGPGHPRPAHSGHRRPPAATGGRIRVILGVVGGVLGLFCAGGIAAAVVGGDDGPEAAAETAAAPAPGTKRTTAKRAPGKAAGKAPAQGGLGDRVRDGRFEFTVTKLDCSKSQVGGQFLNKRAQGKFCQVSVTVKNVGDKARLFDGSAQRALDAGGSEYANDAAAEVFVNEDNATFRSAIDPGASASGRLIFDVPRSTTLTRLELHDTLSSGGVQVSLT